MAQTPHDQYYPMIIVMRSKHIFGDLLGVKVHILVFFRILAKIWTLTPWIKRKWKFWNFSLKIHPKWTSMPNFMVWSALDQLNFHQFMRYLGIFDQYGTSYIFHGNQQPTVGNWVVGIGLHHLWKSMKIGYI